MSSPKMPVPQAEPEFAVVIVEQLGGMRQLKAFVNAQQFVYSKEELWLKFRFSGSRRCNLVKIFLDPSDTYSLEFWSIPSIEQMLKGRDAIMLERDVLVYCDQLMDRFEQATGLYLTLSRRS